MICEDKILGMIALRTVARFAPLALAALFIGCSYDPAPPSPLPSSGSQVLHGTVYPGGTTTVWVQAPREGTFSLSLTDENPSGVPLAISFGGPTGAEGKCETENPIRMDTTSAAQPALAESA